MPLNIFKRQHRVRWLIVAVGVLVVALFFVLGYRSYRTAANLRDEICRLELGKSSFEEVSSLSRHYQGHIFSHDYLPESCSPEGCTYVMHVENPLSKIIKVGPRTAFVVRVSVYEHVLKSRELILARLREGRELDVSLGQFSESDWEGEERVARYSKVQTVEVRVPAHASMRFVELADNLNLRCLVKALGCKEAAEMLPFLKGRIK
jgi:hypothetical protein